MKVLKTLNMNILAVVVLWYFSGIALAIPSAEFKYLETDLGGGVWQYDYTLFNTSDPIIEAGFDLYDVFLTFDPSATFNVVSLPLGWDWTGGSGFVDTFSQNAGTPPVGADIAAGSFLSDFKFQFDYQARSLPFEALFTNPIDPENPVSFSGTTSHAGVPIPEPSTLFLLGAGLAGMVLIMKGLKIRG